MADDLTPLIADWPGEHSLAVVDRSGVVGVAGDLDVVRRIASITKLFTAYTALIAVEEGTISLDDPAGPAGSTVRHLLAHASGLPFEGSEPVATVGDRRVYSNTGIEVLARHLEGRAGMPFGEYLGIGVLEPLGLGHVATDVSPAHGLRLSIRELLVFVRELLEPTLIHGATFLTATTPVFPLLRGVLPGFGSIGENPWGLGFEIRGTKDPHWTAPRSSPETFGHFGGAGSFLWVDPVRRLAAVSTGTVEFGAWAAEAWPVANAAVLDRYAPE
ncbi:MAG: serine hydrolase domain-containing protein [Actinomycetota bacterium]